MSPETKRSRWVAVGVAGVAIVLVAISWRPLVGWFTGSSSGSAPSALGPAQTAGAFQLEAKLDPDPPAQSGNTLWLHVADAKGQAVDGAQVAVEYRMPPMGGMSEMKGSADVSGKGSGLYAARFDLPMAGGWTLHVDVRQGEQTGSAEYGLTVGSAGLIAKGGSGGQAAGQGGSGEVAYWTCAMHPSVHASGPGKCPICGMELHPVPKAAAPGAISLDAQQRQEGGVLSEPVQRAPMDASIRALGKVTVDETRLTDVTLRVKGWIQNLKVDTTGQSVRKGQVLFTLYSPDVFAAEQEYLLALHAQSSGVGEQLARAARQKLELWGLSGAQISAIAQRGKPIENVPFLSPADGVVLEKNVVEGAAVDAGQRLYRIAPLDRVWVDAQVYESDLPSVQVGQPAQVSLPSMPGKTLSGKVTFVEPTLEGDTRTGTVRVELPNPGLALKPDMFADVRLERSLGTRLQVPAEAVIFTGSKRIVFVDEGDGRLVPREVTLGARAGDRYEVLSGLKDGEKVVTHGTFLVASESRLESSAYWAQVDASAGEPTPGGPRTKPPAPQPSSPDAMPGMQMGGSR